MGLSLGLSTSSSLAGNLPALYVTFVANHTFAVALVDGTPVGTTSAPGAPIPAGSYQLYLNDASGAVMQFDLAGPGVSLVDNMSDAEELSASYVEMFQPSSTYTYRDDYQPGVVWTFSTTATVLPNSSSNGTGATTSPGGPTSPSNTSGGASSVPTSSDVVGSGVKADPFRGTLIATVGAKGTLAMTLKGKAAATLRSGRYTITVTDQSSKAGFTLQEIRRPAEALSGIAFVGKRTVNVDLTPGQWFFYPTILGAKSYFIVIA